MNFGKGHHLHLIDGSAFIFRAYHALPPLTRNSDGLPVGAVSGFCNMLQRYVESNTGPDAPTHVAVIFDKGSHTFRNDLYDQYKSNRDEMPEDLRPQMPLTRRFKIISFKQRFNLSIIANHVIQLMLYQIQKIRAVPFNAEGIGNRDSGLATG